MGEPSSSIDRNRLREALWPAALAVTIFFASGNSEVAAPSGIPGIDKIAHFLVFGLLGTLTVRVVHWPGHRVRNILVTVLIVSAYGVVDEFRQSFTPGRAVEVADWVADSAGALLACLLYCYVPAWRRMLEWTPKKAESVSTPATAATSAGVSTTTDDSP